MNGIVGSALVRHPGVPVNVLTFVGSGGHNRPPRESATADHCIVECVDFLYILHLRLQFWDKGLSNRLMKAD